MISGIFVSIFISMKYKDFFSLTEVYVGNCVDIIDYFDDDSTEPGMCVAYLMDSSNVKRIDRETFYRYVPASEVPSNASKGKDIEYYFILDGTHHPSSHYIHFVLYSINSQKNDIHYFFECPNFSEHDEKYILSLPNIPNGNGISDF